MIHPSVPADHTPAEAGRTEFDVIVLGAGAVGENVVSKPRAAGMSVAIVEPELVGGECSYWACMPSKGLLRPVQVLAEATHIGGAIPGATGLDAGKVLERRDKFNSGLDDSGQVSWVESTGTTLIRGRGALAGERRVSVTGADGSVVELTAKVAVAVCTGSTAAVPPPLADCEPWTNREGTSAESVPGSLVVVGGGPVGCELAQAWRRLGARVDLVNDMDRLLPTLEPEAGARLLAAMEAAGVTVHLGAKIVSSRVEGGRKVVALADGTSLEADEVLVGAGRRPTTSDIGLDSVGLGHLAGKPIEVDDTTTVAGVRDGDGQPWLYACGDCTTRPRLTHMGKYAARICSEVITRRAAGAAVGDPAPYTRVAATADHTAVPAVVFTDPEVASVGLSEADASRAGIPVRGVTYEIGDVAGAAVYADGYDGWAKIVIDTERGVIVGATFVGPGVAELLHAGTIAIVGEVPLDRLWHAVPSYPTVSEIWLRLLETAGY